MLAKRIFDFVCALLGLLVLSPLLLLIMLLIKLDSPGPVFFCQLRVGQFERHFLIYKFRTMIVAAESKGLKLTVGCDPRITRLGRVLRLSKLDELPQLLNVLIGQMSLVGPRPEVLEYVKHYPLTVRGIVFRVKPGITDWASIKMIDENKLLAQAKNPEQLYLEQLVPLKLAYAVKYVKTRTFGGDILLILLTLAKIFTR